MAGQPDPRPPRRVKATAAQWRVIRENFGDARCVACPNRAESLHHLVPKSQGGDDLPINLAPLCGNGTMGCHGEFETHGPQYARVAGKLRSFICSDPERWKYVQGRLGEVGFDRRYPHPRRFFRCIQRDCVLEQGHPGAHAALSDERFQRRGAK